MGCVSVKSPDKTIIKQKMQIQTTSMKPEQHQEKQLFGSGYNNGLYANVCSLRPDSYHLYREFEIDWASGEEYQIVRKLGKGKYSEVYEGCHQGNNSLCVIKVLLPDREDKSYRIQRESKILQTLYGGPNVIKLFDMVRLQQTNCLVFECLPNFIETKEISKTFKLLDIQLYTYKILEALDYAHAHGIIHRDFKPNNLVIDDVKKELRVIDWGLAEYYLQNQKLNPNCGTRNYKAPELLIEDRSYHYSVDVWAVGCTLAAWLFNIKTMFRGHDNQEQLNNIIKVRGSEELIDYMRAKEIKSKKVTVKERKAISLRSFIDSKNKDRVNQDGLDLLERLLCMNKDERITPRDALTHKFFQPIRVMQMQSSFIIDKDKSNRSK